MILMHVDASYNVRLRVGISIIGINKITLGFNFGKGHRMQNVICVVYKKY